ncbi:MAG: sigma-54-dependent Fis family transcriptional regulator [Acidobacteria bacterium]|nr:sigma-54-dependent Fis family transcriptional regulator [Acidobacteriota bacterium]
MIERLATCEATVLIEGEIGTGKEVAARAIHYLGGRRNGPFTPINCGAMPDSLFENELFGHVRGAFTDARDTSGGLIANADGGTLFLDEVEVLSPKGQVALLRFLQDGTYRPLGGKRLVTANVRVIGASNVSLRELVARGEFRADLMYRLAVMPLVLPPLRAREGDVSLLAHHFLARFNAQYRTSKRLSPASLAALEAHTWPGNVRELENVLHREVLLCDGETIELADRLPPSAAPGGPGRGRVAFERGFRAAKASCVADFERRFVCWALEQSGGNVSAAARRAGKERRTFARLVKKYAVDRDRLAG